MAIDSATIALARMQPMKGMDALKGANKADNQGNFAAQRMWISMAR